MKLRSVKNLYLVKKLLHGTVSEVTVKKSISLINSVLLSEGGSKAVLYPYNSFEETILQLWGEAMSPRDIASKVGLERDGEEVVLCVIEDQGNYEEE